MDYARLDEALRPLLDKFYRNQRSAMRGVPGAQAWVARAGDIVAALNLAPVPGGYWLTGLLVAENQRRQGIAHTLLGHALATCDGPTWLFCHPDLIGFYQPLGFTTCTALPPALAERLKRYQRTKELVALQAPAAGLAYLSSGNSTSV
ncbi:GNAT family N-acetyltransferase [Pseudomonas sp. nanlin1]|uniref:GNAT family N-acetyltransferase n=1 Tax=Pseudomonas sp. nanlin1 TaxID=3040605 RepID=UPI00388E2F49